MSELRSVIEQLRGESLAALPDARLEEDFAELQHAVEQLEVERLRRLAEIDRRKLRRTSICRVVAGERVPAHVGRGS